MSLFEVSTNLDSELFTRVILFRQFQQVEQRELLTMTM